MKKGIIFSIMYCFAPFTCAKEIVLHNVTPYTVGIFIKSEQDTEETLIKSDSIITLKESTNPCTLSLYTAREKTIFLFELPSEYMCPDNECTISSNKFQINVDDQTKLVLESVDRNIVLDAPEQKSDSETVLKSPKRSIFGIELSNAKTFLKAIRAYYLTGLYENDLKEICKRAQEIFAVLEVHENDVVIFDIDDTALIAYADRDSFLWPNKEAFQTFRAEKLWRANEPVLELYKNLLKQGYKIIFMSGRLKEIYDVILERLKNAGYTDFDALILKDEKNQASEVWKQSMRKELSQRYKIVGSIGDRDKDFMGGYTGIQVRLPNFLYD